MSSSPNTIQERLEDGKSADPTWSPEPTNPVTGSDNQEREDNVVAGVGSDEARNHFRESMFGQEYDNQDDPDESIVGAAASDAVSYSCKESGCQWICNHHEHLSPKKDFFCPAEIFLYHAERGCPGCGLWTDIASRRCACRDADDEYRSRKEYSEVHPSEWIEAKFDGRRFPIVEMFTRCETLSSTRIELAGIQDLDTSVSQFGGCVHLDRLSPECISLFRDWIHNCNTHHSLCSVTDSPVTPKRLLDVGERGTREVKLRSMSSGPVKYLALSYCWGGSRPPQTTLENKADHERGFAWHALPRSYRDTVSLAHELGVPYIWIDTYCIVQDDKEERDTEIARMGSIFQNAYLVVIAASSPSPYSGYLENNSNYRAGDGRAKFKWRESLVHYRELKSGIVKFREVVHARGQARDACTQTRVGKRAWTYQERLFASRCLIFQGREVIWECKTSCLCECGGARLACKNYEPHLLPPPISQTSMGTQSSRRPGERLFRNEREAYHFWRKAVQAFSSRHLTYGTDRLPAMSALASIVQTAAGDQYLAGLWKGDLVRQMTWQNFPSYDDLIPYDAYVAPSWSWASTPAPTMYSPHPVELEAPSCVSLLEARCFYSGPDLLGAVQDGYLILHGVHCDALAVIHTSPEKRPMITLCLENGLIHKSEGSYCEFYFLDGLRVQSVGAEITRGRRCSTLQRLHVSTGTDQARCSGRVRLLWLEDDVCLLLAYSLRSPGSFERIGILDSDMSPRLPDIPLSTIRLI